MPRKHSTVSLNDLPTATSNQVPAWMQKLREAAMAQIDEAVVEGIVQKQVELAKAGNPAATKFVFEQILGGAAFKGANITQNVTNHHYHDGAAGGGSSEALPGTDDKIEAMSARVAQGRSVFDEADAERDLS